jgi:hypothetical protein
MEKRYLTAKNIIVKSLLIQGLIEIVLNIEPANRLFSAYLLSNK